MIITTLQLQLMKKNKSTKKKVNIYKKKKLKSKATFKFKNVKHKQKRKNLVSVKTEVVKKPRKQRKLTSPTSPLMYFTQDTENAVIEYNSTDDVEQKNKIYVDRLHYPFSKLVENIFNTFHFSYFETSPFDVQKECLSHLVSNIHKFDPERKSRLHPHLKARAYSYFSIVAKHFLILLNNNNYKKFNQNVVIGEDHEEHTVQLQQTDKHHGQVEMNDFMRLMVEYFEKNIDKIFPKEKDAEIANAIVELLRNSTKIEIFNKKMLYLVVREISDCKTQNITRIINRMKIHYKIISNDYKNSGMIDV